MESYNSYFFLLSVISNKLIAKPLPMDTDCLNFDLLAVSYTHLDVYKRQVIVSSPKITFPIAVRYGWANNPECTLYNKAGLPASPFRTDDWPGITQSSSNQ